RGGDLTSEEVRPEDRLEVRPPAAGHPSEAGLHGLAALGLAPADEHAHRPLPSLAPGDGRRAGFGLAARQNQRSPYRRLHRPAPDRGPAAGPARVLRGLRLAVVLGGLPAAVR